MPPNTAGGENFWKVGLQNTTEWLSEALLECYMAHLKPQIANLF